MPSSSPPSPGSGSVRPRDPGLENQVLHTLVEQLDAPSPGSFWPPLLSAAQRLCAAPAAVALATDETATSPLRWAEQIGLPAGALADGLPRELDPLRGAFAGASHLLLREPARLLPGLRTLTPPVNEALLVRFGPVATPTGLLAIFVATRACDAEDLRLLTSLAHLAAAARQLPSGESPAAAAARRRLDAALIAGELGVFEWDVPQDRIAGDPNLLHLFGLSPASGDSFPLGRFLEAVHPDDLPHLRQAIGRSLETRGNFEADYRVRTPAGVRWVNSRGRVVTGSTGQVEKFYGIVVDVTARKEAEHQRETIAAELRRLTAIHETVLSSTEDFAYLFDRDGRFLYANRRLLTVWARPLDQIVGKTCHDLGYPEWHADLHMREIAQVIATKRPIRGEVPFTGGSGISGIYDYIFTPVLGADGEVEFIAGTTRDVTERRRTEDRDRFLVTLDDASRPLTEPAAITRTYATLLGEYLRVNRVAYADVEADADTFNLTGDYTRAVPSIIGRYRFADFGAECLRQMRAGEPYVVEDSATDPRVDAVRDAYLATHIRAVVCVPLHKAGQFVAALAVHQSTPRAWQPHEIELVHAVANRCWESIERARVLRALADSERHLARLHADAVQASRAKDDFLAALSHELRTPLNPVLLLAGEHATDTALPASVRDAFDVIRRNVELEARLIDDLLDLTGITRGKVVLQPRLISAHEVVREALAALRADLHRKRLRCDLHLAAPAHHVSADPARLLQVFLNLLRNAVKFTPEGGAITLTSAQPDGTTWILRITDTGIGMTPGEIDRAFAPFEQGDHAADGGASRFGGLGLGLSIARRFAELHGGTIEASSPGRNYGSTFVTRLPLAPAPVAPTPAPAPPPAPDQPATPRAAPGLRLLLVEDHAPTRDALQLLLRRRAHSVTCADSVAQALAAASRERFDFVLSDIGLPDGDGATLMRELHTRHGLRGIALTGYGMEADIARCLEAGFISHLTKPVRIQSLDAALSRIIPI